MADKQVSVNLSFTADTSKARAQLQDLQRQLSTLTSNVNQGNANFGFTTQIQKASTAAAVLKTQLKEATNVKTGQLDLTKFNQSLKASGMSLDTYRKTLTSLGPDGVKAFTSLAQSVGNAEIPLKRTNTLLTSFFTTLKNVAKYQISTSVYRLLAGSIQQAYSYAKNLNESLNNIRIVTGQSADQMADFAKKANESARALSTTTTAYTDAALIFYQQGLTGDAVTERTDAVIKMANVTGQSASEVSSYMTAIWNNFDDGSESLEHYADVITNLGAHTASSSAEIAEGLEKFASVADTVGLSYEYATTALATVVAQTRQSADVVGTAFKTLFARIQDLELGEALDDGTTLGKYSAALDAVGVNIKNVNGQMKDMDVILNELGSKWNTLGKDQQIALAQTVAGTRQYTQLIALMDNWETFQENLGYANNADGTLQKQADIYAESWEAASKKVRASAEKMYQSLIDDKFFIKLTNDFSKMIDFVSSFVESLGGVKGILITIGAIAAQHFGANGQLAQGIQNITNNLSMMTKAGRQSIIDQKTEANNQLVNLSSSLAGGDTNSATGQAYAAIGVAQQELINNSENLNESQLKIAQTLLDIHRQEAQRVIDLDEQNSKLKEQSDIYEQQLIYKSKHSKSYEDGNRPKSEDIANTIQQSKALGNLEALTSSGDLKESTFAIEDFESKIKEAKNQLGDLGQVGNESFNQILKVVQNFKDGTMTLEQFQTEITKIKSDMGEGIVKNVENSGFNEKDLKTYYEAIAAAEKYGKTQGELVAGTIGLKSSTQNLGSTFKELPNQINQSAEALSNMISGCSSLAMALNSVKGLFNVWSNEDATAMDKLLQTMISLGLIVNGLTKSYKSLNAVIAVFNKTKKTEEISKDTNKAKNVEETKATAEAETTAKNESYQQDVVNHETAEKQKTAITEKEAAKRLGISKNRLKELKEKEAEDIAYLNSDKYKKNINNSRSQQVRSRQKDREDIKREQQENINSATTENNTKKVTESTIANNTNAVSKKNNTKATKEQTGAVANETSAEKANNKAKEEGAATSALSSGILIGLIAVLVAATLAYQHLNKSLENNIEKEKEKLDRAKESLSVEKEELESSKEKADNLDTLTKEYAKLNEEKEKGLITSSELRTKTIELCNQYDQQSLSILALSANYKELNALMEQSALLAAKAQEKEASDVAGSAQSALEQYIKTTNLENGYDDTIKGIMSDIQGGNRNSYGYLNTSTMTTDLFGGYFDFLTGGVFDGTEKSASEWTEDIVLDVLKLNPITSLPAFAVQAIKTYSDTEDTKAKKNKVLNQIADLLGTNIDEKGNFNLANIDVSKYKDNIKEVQSIFENLDDDLINDEGLRNLENALNSEDFTEFIDAQVEAINQSLNAKFSQIKLESDLDFSGNNKDVIYRNLTELKAELIKEAELAFPDKEADELNEIVNNYLASAFSNNENVLKQLNKSKLIDSIKGITNETKKIIEGMTDSQVAYFTLYLDEDATENEFKESWNNFRDYAENIIKNEGFLEGVDSFLGDSDRTEKLSRSEVESLYKDSNFEETTGVSQDRFATMDYVDQYSIMADYYFAQKEFINENKQIWLDANKEELEDELTKLQETKKANDDTITYIEDRLKEYVKNSEISYSELRSYIEAYKEYLTKGEWSDKTQENGFKELDSKVKGYIENIAKAEKENDSLEKSMSQINNAFADAADTISDVSKAAEIYEGKIKLINSSIDSIQSSYETMKSVVEDYNDNGMLTLDNMQALLSLSPEMLSCLELEGNQLKINKQALSDIIVSRIDEAEAAIYEEAAVRMTALAENDLKTATDNETASEIANQTALYGTVEAAIAAAEAFREYAAAKDQALKSDNSDYAKQLDEDVSKRIAMLESTKKAYQSGSASLFDETTSTKKSSGGSGKDTKDLDKLEKELDVCRDINRELKTEEHLYNLISKQKDKYFGSGYIQAIEKETESLKKQEELQRRKLKLQVQELANKKATLKALGVEFDEQGNIANYNDLIAQQVALINEQIALTNSLTGDAKETAKETAEKMKKQLESLEKKMEAYESIQDAVLETESALSDLEDKAYELFLKEFTWEIELNLDKSQIKRDWIEFKKKMADIDENDFIANGKYDLQTMNTYLTAGGDIQEYTRMINETLANDQLNSKDKREMLKEYLSGLEDALEAVKEIEKEIKETYIKLIDDVNDKMSEQVKQYEHINNLLQHQSNLITLLYGDIAYSKQLEYYEALNNSNLGQLEFLRLNKEYWEDLLSKLEEGSDEWKKCQEQLMATQESLNTLVEQSITNITDKYKTAIKEAIQETEKALTGGFALDTLSYEVDLDSKLDKAILDPVTQLLEAQKLANKIKQSIEDTDDISQQAKLNSLLKNQVEDLKTTNNLRQYDVDRANELYEITLKQMALDDAKANKDALRLVRDSQGNWIYQYTADMDNLEKANDDLLEEQGKLYQLDRNALSQYTSEYVSTLKEMFAEMEKVAIDTALSPEDKDARKNMIIQDYQELLDSSAMAISEIQPNITASGIGLLGALQEEDPNILSLFDPEDQMVIQEMLANLGNDYLTFENGVISGWSEIRNTVDGVMSDINEFWDSAIIDMVNKFYGSMGEEGEGEGEEEGPTSFREAVMQTWDDIITAQEKWKVDVQKISAVSGQNFKNISANIAVVNGMTNTLTASNANLMASIYYETQAAFELVSELQQMMNAYAGVIDAAMTAAEAAYYYTTEADDAYQMTMNLAEAAGIAAAEFDTLADSLNNAASALQNYNGANGASETIAKSKGQFTTTYNERLNGNEISGHVKLNIGGHDYNFAVGTDKQGTLYDAKGNKIGITKDGNYVISNYDALANNKTQFRAPSETYKKSSGITSTTKTYTEEKSNIPNGFEDLLNNVYKPYAGSYNEPLEQSYYKKQYDELIEDYKKGSQDYNPEKFWSNWLDYYSYRTGIYAFSKGGEITAKTSSLLDELLKGSGEDTMIAVREGERVLSQDQTSAFDRLVYDILPALTNGGLFNMLSNLSSFENSLKSSAQSVDTSVTTNEANTYNITAEFPNATNSSEIEEAFLSLKNYASQYAWDKH